MVETNSSGQGICDVLMQYGHPIDFITGALSPRHTALLVYDRELLAIIHVVTKRSQYLLGQKFIIKTNQRTLKFLMEQKFHSNSQYVIEYKKKIKNKVSNVLFRVSGVELFSLVISTTIPELLQVIAHSWDIDTELKALIEQLKVDLVAHMQFTWHQDQLRR